MKKNILSSILLGLVLLLLTQTLQAQPASEMLGCRKFSECCWLTAHNAFTSTHTRYTHVQQGLTLHDQMEYGVRSFMLDTWSWNDFDTPPAGAPDLDTNGIYLFHGVDFDWLPGFTVPNYGVDDDMEHVRMFKWLNEMGAWLREPGHQDEIFTLNLENYSDNIKWEYELEFVDQATRDMFFQDYNNLQTLTLSQIRNSGKRIIILSSYAVDDVQVNGISYHFPSPFDYTVENTYNANEMHCLSRNATPLNTPNMMFTFNHFGDNTLIVPRWSNACAFDIPVPNFLAVDHVEEGDPGPMAAVREFNRRLYDQSIGSAWAYKFQFFTNRLLDVTGAGNAGSQGQLSATGVKFVLTEDESSHTYYIHYNDLVLGAQAPIDGGEVELQDLNGSASQRWFVEPAPGGGVRFRNQQYDNYYMTAASSDLGAQMYIDIVTIFSIDRQNFNMIKAGNNATIGCKNAILPTNAAGQVQVNASDVSNEFVTFIPCGVNGNLSVSPATLLCTNGSQQMVTLTFDDGQFPAISCTATVTVLDKTPPVPVCKPTTVQIGANGLANLTPASIFQSATDICGSGMFTPQATMPPTFDCTNIGENVALLVVSDNSGNTGTCTTTVTVVDNIAPTLTCKNFTAPLDATGNVALGISAIFQSSADNCGVVTLTGNSPSTFTCANLGANVVTLTAHDNHGNTAACTGTVTVVDNVAPSVVCKPATVALNGAGMGNLTPAAVFESGSDNCGTVNPQGVGPNFFACANLGANTVTLTVNDGHGNTATCQTTVTVVDNIAPLAVCKNATVNLNASGTGSITTASVFDNGSDNCGTVNQESVAPNTFSCGNLGANTVTLTVNDGHGNTATCNATVTVADNAAPTVVCQPFTVYLSAAGTAAITTGNVFQSGSDNCGTVNQQSVAPASFTCGNLGANTVTLTVNDGHGNTATCAATVTVADNIIPTMLCKNVTLNLDASGNATLTLAQVNNGSYDNCTIATMGLGQTSFTCANIGNNTVVLDGTDQSGNKGQCTSTVTVKDVIAPVALCKNLTVNLNSSGQASVLPSAVNNGSSDVCGISSMTLTPNAFTCSNVGANAAVLAVTDPGGNTTTCTATITVKDLVAPQAKCKNITANLDGNGQVNITASQIDNGSSDACGIATMTINNNAFNCSNIGSAITVTMTVKDVNNNSATCQSQVTVKDNAAPTAICENVAVQLNAQGKATVYGATLAQDSYDNCSVWSYSPVSKQYTTANLGVNNLTITVKDWSNNASTCVSQVTVLPYGGNLVGNTSAESADEAVEQAEERVGTEPTAAGLRVFPNPTAATATVRFSLPADGACALSVFDLSGRLVMNRRLEGLEGENSVDLDFGAMPAGLYLIDIQSDGLRMQKRLAVQRD